MAAGDGVLDSTASELRQRGAGLKALKDSDVNKGGSGSGNSSEQATPTAATSKKSVYGRTPDGTVFKIPQTHNVLAGLFDPRLPKSSLDLVTLATLGSQVLLWLYLPLDVSKYLFMALFAFWRLAYNAGLGWLLTQQSKRKFIVNTVKRNAWLDENKHPLIKNWIKTQVSIKMGKDYDFDAMPVEWNTWVLFRHSVDIILLNDFLSYFFCGISFLTFPDASDSKAVFMCVLRWVAGITLLVFNLWVKTDAHRIITDLAWYWADTFFTSMQDLVFDGVFEMAPHPMYSVGYAGYYGLSLIAGSEAVLYVSLAAHACQFAFLVFFEEPHIERTYGERKPIAMRTPLPATARLHPDLSGSAVAEEGEELNPFEASTSRRSSPLTRGNTPRPRKTRITSEASSADAADSLADTPCGTDVSDYDTDTDSAAHTFSAGGVNSTAENNNANRRPSVASSTTSTDLDAEYDAPAPSSFVSSSETSGFKTSDRPHIRSQHDFDAWYFRQDTIIFQNFDPLRATDFAFGLATVYLCAAFVLPYLSPRQQLVAVFLNALLWRIGHTFVLGSILKAQSERKWLVRHYLKHYHYEGTGYGAVEEAFSNWKSIYNMSLCMVYGSFGLLALKCYDWALTEEKLRHILGLMLIALHMWTSKGIYEVLGRFGWFYGDFFIASETAPPQLIYTGIYRHVNNPERIMGGAAFFGLALISGSKLVGILAIISVLSHFWFLSRVENPHMRKLYGDNLRQEAGVTKTFKGVASKNAHRAPPKVARAVQEFQGTLERVYDDTALALEDFLKKSAPRLSGYVENTKVLLRESGERLLITRVANVAALDRSAYSVKIERPEDNAGGEHLPDLPQSKGIQYQLGQPIRVNWTAPSNCSRRDWIGLYRHGANKSKLVTRIRSKGRWLGIYPDEWDGNDSLSPEGTSTSQGSKGPKKSGSLLFTGHRLFWKTGQYEFRYHHDGKHNVMAVSEPFEIKVEHPSNPLSYTSVYSTLLPLVARALDSDPQLVPETAWPLLKEQPDEATKAKIHAKRTDEHDFVLYTNEQAERIASVIEESSGIELMSDVIVAEANLARLSRSIVESQKLLKPFDKLDKT